MSLIDLLQPGEDPYSRQDILTGVVVGLVTNNQDPDEMGRVKLTLPWLSEEHETDWARVVSPMAGADRGIFFLPEVEDEVLVAFEHGDIRKPIVLGSLWNGSDSPPETNSDGENNIRIIKSRSGNVLIFDDTDGSEKIELKDSSGNNSIVIDHAENTITISSDKDIVFTASQGKISFDCQDLEIKTSADAKIEAGGNMDIKASSDMKIEGATVNIN